MVVGDTVNEWCLFYILKIVYFGLNICDPFGFSHVHLVS